MQQMHEHDDGQDAFVDYTEDFPGCIVAHARGRNMVILRKIDPVLASRIRADGKRASYEIEVRWLSRDARPNTDDYVCVESGPTFEYWQARELPSLHRAVQQQRLTNVFDHINLFG